MATPTMAILLVASLFLVSVSLSLAVNHCPPGHGHQLSGHYCGLGGGRCPSGHYCEIAPNDAYAVCCPIATQFNPCLSGVPIDGQNCRVFPCPDYHYCQAAPNNVYSVCCPSHCEHGRPYMVNGTSVNCGRGGTRCPAYYHCNVSPVDAWAVCCRD